jgi:diacylglycerol kinase (ATP)
MVLGYLAVSRFLFAGVLIPEQDYMRTTGNLAILSVVLVVLLVILAKARIGKGTPLHGGMPSGHAGVAFSVATSVSFTDISVLMVCLAWLLASLVALSRVLLGIHNFREVVAGSLIGILTTSLLHMAFRY